MVSFPQQQIAKRNSQNSDQENAELWWLQGRWKYSPNHHRLVWWWHTLLLNNSMSMFTRCGATKQHIHLIDFTHTRMEIITSLFIIGVAFWLDNIDIFGSDKHRNIYIYIVASTSCKVQSKDQNHDMFLNSLIHRFCTFSPPFTTSMAPPWAQRDQLSSTAQGTFQGGGIVMSQILGSCGGWSWSDGCRWTQPLIPSSRGGWLLDFRVNSACYQQQNYQPRMGTHYGKNWL